MELQILKEVHYPECGRIIGMWWWEAFFERAYFTEWDQKTKAWAGWGEGRPEGALRKLAPSSFYLEHDQHIQ